ncbi:MAG: hypothetical protein U0T82_04840 [Bacteroidales bacterium]
MQEKDHTFIALLKQEIVKVLQESHPGINPCIEEWKGQEIERFQEDLRVRVNAHISEKWFYTHIKGNNKSLPRIDMLDLLSRYCGYKGWDDFTYHFRPKTTTGAVQKNPNRYFLFVPLLSIAILSLLFIIFKLFNTREYRFCFMDSETHELIANPATEVTLLLEGESPMHRMAGEDGSLRVRTDLSRIRMVVKSPYYRTDTIERIVRKLNNEETILLEPNDYALMLHYFSTTRVEDWQKRRHQLEEIISENAMAYRVLGGPESEGVALYTRQEFIDILTMPTGSLKNMEILSTREKNGRIVFIRFRIKELPE